MTVAFTDVAGSASVARSAHISDDGRDPSYREVNPGFDGLAEGLAFDDLPTAARRAVPETCVLTKSASEFAGMRWGGRPATAPSILISTWLVGALQ